MLLSPQHSDALAVCWLCPADLCVQGSAAGAEAGEAAWRAVKAIGFVSRDTGRSLGNLIHQKGRDQVSSPVGIVRASARAASAATCVSVSASTNRG